MALKLAIAMRIFNNQKGGKEIFTWNLVQKLLDEGHAVQIVASQYNEISHPNIEYHPVTVWGKSIGLHRWFFAKNSRRVVEKIDYDICLTHGKAGYGDVIRIGGLPINRHLAVMAEEHDTTIGSWWYRFRKKFSLSTRMSISLERQSFTENSDLRKVFVASSLIKKELLKGYPSLPADNIEVIHNGYDPDIFNLDRRDEYRSTTRRELGIDNDKLVGIFVGNDFRRKGFTNVLNVLRNNDNVELIVVGRGENFNRGSLPEELSDRIYWQGEVRDVDRYYAASDYLILPTKTDGFGLVVLEALAMGLYVIVSTNCGASEIIRGSWQGAVTDDWHGLDLDELEPGLFDEEMVHRRAESARNHTWSAVGQQYIDNLNSLVE